MSKHLETVLSAILVVAGLVVLAVGWRGAAGTVDLQVQVSYVLSGGLLGLSLVGAGCGLAIAQADRVATRDVALAHRHLARQCRTLTGILPSPAQRTREREGAA